MSSKYQDFTWRKGRHTTDPQTVSKIDVNKIVSRHLICHDWNGQDLYHYFGQINGTVVI